MQKGIPLPNNYGVQDRTFRMPGAVEFPKMAYKKDASNPKGYIEKVVKDQEEQDALGKGWLTDPKDIHALLESFTKSAEDEDNPPAAAPDAPAKPKKEKKARAKKSTEDKKSEE